MRNFVKSTNWIGWISVAVRRGRQFEKTLFDLSNNSIVWSESVGEKGREEVGISPPEPRAVGAGLKRGEERRWNPWEQEGSNEDTRRTRDARRQERNLGWLSLLPLSLMERCLTDQDDETANNRWGGSRKSDMWTETAWTVRSGLARAPSRVFHNQALPDWCLIACSIARVDCRPNHLYLPHKAVWNC